MAEGIAKTVPGETVRVTKVGSRVLRPPKNREGFDDKVGKAAVDKGGDWKRSRQQPPLCLIRSFLNFSFGIF